MTERKKILIDAYNIGLPTGTGVATYARNLTHSVHRLGYETHVLYGMNSSSGSNKLLNEITFFDQDQTPVPDYLQVHRYIKQLATAPFGSWAAPVPMTGQVITTTYQSRLPYFDKLWNAGDIFGRANRYHRFLNGEMRVTIPGGVSIAHWTYPLPIRATNARNIYTLHDLVPLRLPYTTLDNKRKYLTLMRRLVTKADHIVTVSEASRNDIINLLECPPEKVTNTYQAVHIPEKYARKREQSVRDEVEGIFGLRHRGYFLFYGAIEPKKNIGRLIEAHLTSGVEAPLVIVGKIAWKTGQELRLLTGDTSKKGQAAPATPLGRDRILRFDYVPYPMLLSLIRGARAVLFPSLYEGFGLPVLEAMKLGTPVMTSTEGATPEVAGEAAMLVDPYDVRAIADGIVALNRDGELRGDLTQRGLAQAELFSVERYEERLREMYAKLV